MCYGFIYDTIINPYHITNPLCNAVSLSHEETDRITQTFLEVISDFMDLDFFKDVDDLPLNKSDEWAWVKFEMENPDGYAKLKKEVKKTFESMKKKKYVTEHLITRFFMNKFRILIANLPQIHLEHSLKIFKKVGSLSPLPYNKLVEIRLKAGLPIPEYKDQYLDELYY